MCKMKHLVFLLCLLIPVLGRSQSKKELEIRQLEKHWAELLDTSDTVSLAKVWSKDYVVNNPAGKIITGKDIFGFIRNGQTFPAYERIIDSISFSGDIAIVMGKEVSKPQKETMRQIERRFTNIWIKENKKWKLVARQATNMQTP